MGRQTKDSHRIWSEKLMRLGVGHHITSIHAESADDTFSLVMLLRSVMSVLKGERIMFEYDTRRVDLHQGFNVRAVVEMSGRFFYRLHYR